ncbi:GDCCVxC domain-containing (seleno)protein [Candidatus Aenigmatarchaeota archaeon]
MPERLSNLTCPHCGNVQLMQIPKEDVCTKFYMCKKCKKMVKAEKTCCVICDYGDMKCEPQHNPIKK